MTKNLITTKMEELQESITAIVKRIDELKELAQKSLTENIDKIKDLGQEKRKKYVDSVMGVIPFKNYYDKIKDNDYKKLALSVKSDVEGKFNVSIDQLLNAFNISSVKDTKELTEKIEKLEKSIKKIKKEIKKVK